MIMADVRHDAPMSASSSTGVHEMHEASRSQPREIPQRTTALQIPPPTAVSLPPPPSSASRIRNSHLTLDSFSPVNQNGSFEFDRVLKSGYVQKRTRKTKVRTSKLKALD
jgi:hypothetical protein